jgi:hypothetical protein
LKPRFLVLPTLFLVLPTLSLLAFTACDPTEPARATVVNGLPSEGAEAFTIDRAWYRTTLFFRPLKPGESSEAQSVGFGKESAYFVLSIGDPPRRFLAMSENELETAVGEQVRIEVRASNLRSTCIGTPRMSAADWQFTRERIFPGDQVEAFDAPCTGSPNQDGGVEADTGDR